MFGILRKPDRVLLPTALVVSAAIFSGTAVKTAELNSVRIMRGANASKSANSSGTKGRKKTKFNRSIKTRGDFLPELYRSIDNL